MAYALIRSKSRVQPTTWLPGPRSRHPGALGHGCRERLRRRRCTTSSPRSTTSRSARRSIPAGCRRSSAWTSSPASACSRSASAPASTCRCIRRTVRSPESTSAVRCSRRRASAPRARRSGNVRLLQMDAADLKFADDSFDIVYAPYLISVVPDPVKVAQEMRRVCRPGGRIIVLNHFLSPEPDPLAHRAADLAVHDSHRLQGGPRPARHFSPRPTFSRSRSRR